MRKLILGVLFAVSFALVHSAHADSWRMPEVETYTSPDGAWRLTVTPRPLKSQLEYFQDQVDGNIRPGSPDGSLQDRAVAVMEHRRGDAWHAVWQAPLANDVAPVDVVVVPGGAVVTFDNWHSMGHGSNAVVVYESTGRVVREMSLADVLTSEYVEALPRSVSSIHWRGEPFLAADAAAVVVPVVVPDRGQGLGRGDTVDVHVDVGTGHPSVPDATAWARAQAQARDVATYLAEQRAAAVAAFLAPLEAPRTDEMREWHQYLREAFWRLDPGWDEDYPTTKVIPPRGAERFGQLAAYVGDAMVDEASGDGLIMVASPDQTVLLDVLRSQVKRVAPGSLERARIYVAADDQHFPAAREALAPTGATVIQLDTDTSIPQRAERIKRMQEQDE